MEGSTNIKVALRCRPLNKLEKELGCACIVKIEGNGITVTDPNPYNAIREHPFGFDHCYFTQTTQEQIYADLGVPILEKALAGYNGTIFAYGQTGSGKTHSITGTPDAPGIIPRMNRDLFDHIAKVSTPTHPFLVLISYLELYNENIHDLMNPDGKPLKIREHPKFGVYVENLAELVVSNAAEIEAKMIEGNNVRHVAATKMNERSSRSHSVFTIRIEQKDTTSNEGTSLSAKINLVDLAGSERAGKTEAEGSTLKEASMINGSLSALGNVINALADPKKKKGHIPFRSSKLTRLLQESLGGNTVTCMVAAVSPADRNFDETLNTLQYANRAKNIQNVSKKNETNLAKVIKDLRAQIEEITMQLEGRTDGKGRGVADIQRVLAELEFVKQQNWEEKRKMSQKFEANRWVSIAKNGMLQFKANLLRQQTFQAQEEIEVLKDERTQLLAQLAGLDGRVGTLETEVKQLGEDEQRIMHSQYAARAKITDVLTKRIATKWRTQTILRRNSRNLAEYKPGVSNIGSVVTLQEKLHQQHDVILNLKQESEKAGSLESKVNYQTQEMELLQEEIVQIIQENGKLEEQIGEKSKEMEALCEEVAAMLGSENKKIEDLTSKSRGLQEDIKATREASNIMQEELLQELSRQEEAEAKVASLAQENARLNEIRKLELEASKSRVGQLSRSGSVAMSRVGSMSSVYAQHVTPVASDEEMIQGIERSLSGTNLGSISNSVRDGVFLCKLINKAAPGTIDERVLNVNAKVGTQDARENINLCLDSARALGCNLSTVSTDAIMTGDESSITALIAEVVRMGQLSQVSVQKHTNLLNLRDKSEEIATFFKLTPEAILLRWFNHHLSGARHPRTVTNFGKDIKDSENYAVLLNRLADEELCDLAALRKEPDLLARAHCVLEAASALGCKKYVSPRDIIEAHEERNSLFVAYLFEKFPDVEIPAPSASATPSSPSASPRISSPSLTPRGSPLSRSGRTQKELLMQLIEENQGEKREERAMRVWINSLGLPVYVRNLATELGDGMLILQILDKVFVGVVNWKKVNKAPNSIYKKIENCNYCVELGKQLKFSLVGIAGKDIYDGNMKLSLALLSQVMQYYFLNMLKTLRFGGKEVKEDDIIKWMNDKVASLPPSRPSALSAQPRARITGFKDPALATGLAFIDLLQALRPGCVAQELVQRGETREQSLANAKYVISVARKIGASTFLVPEDIVELNGKMILAFVGSLMSSLQDS